jgi:divalent metal cation (Fe/Co/Zn/Cd) transporter
MSILTGILHVMNGTTTEASVWSYAVLAIAAVFEGISWWFGCRAFRSEQRGRGVVETIQISKDPTTFSVLLEDSAALAGLAIAFAGIFMSQQLGTPWIDGASSIVIGVLLCQIALVMVYESKGLLIGEGVTKETAHGVRTLISAESGAAVRPRRGAPFGNCASEWLSIRKRRLDAKDGLRLAFHDAKDHAPR